MHWVLVEVYVKSTIISFFVVEINCFYTMIQITKKKLICTVTICKLIK